MAKKSEKPEAVKGGAKDKKKGKREKFNIV